MFPHDFQSRFHVNIKFPYKDRLVNFPHSLTCRTRHLKCDEQLPVCKRCRKGQRQCQYPPRNAGRGFRHDLNSASVPRDHGRHSAQGNSNNGQWISSPSQSVEFVDETAQVAAEYSRSVSPVAGLSVFSALGNSEEEIVANARTGLTIEQLLDHRSKDGGRTGSLLSPVLSELARIQSIESSVSSTSSFPSIVLDESSARLFRHYIVNLGPWLDTTDVHAHFTRDVPQKALRSPILLNALLAFAARHLAKISDYDSEAADYFHSACVKLLIPALSDQASAAADPTILAATVLLRIYEQLNVNLTGGDDERHLWGTSALVDLQPYFHAPTAGGIRQAAFWVFIRQDIYMALVHQRPMRCDLESFQVDVTFDAQDDSTWANWAIWLVGRILHFCFGSAERTWEKWNILHRLMDTWEERKPQSFVPYYYKERSLIEKQYFPILYHFDRIHVTGWQYFQIGRILLAIYNPRNDEMKAGLELQRAQRRLQKTVLHHARELYGMAFASPTFAPAKLTSCNSLPLFGPWFTDRNEQMLLIDLLKAAENENGWPTADVQYSLMHEWGWMEDV